MMNFSKKVDSDGYKTALQTAHFLRQRITQNPKILILVENDLGFVGDVIEDNVTIDYKYIPNFPELEHTEHPGRLTFGKLFGHTIACMRGCFYHHEGYTPQMIAFPLKVFSLLGVKLLITITTSHTSKFKPGDILILKDHVNLISISGNSPLRGPNDDRFGPRFPNMTNVYDEKLRKLGVKLAKAIFEGHVHEGVVISGGCERSTPAETEFLQTLGDATSMVGVLEAVAAKYCNIDVFALSLIADAGARQNEMHLKEFVTQFIKHLE